MSVSKREWANTVWFVLYQSLIVCWDSIVSFDVDISVFFKMGIIEIQSIVSL